MAVKFAPTLGSGGFGADYTAGVADFDRLRRERLAKAQASMRKNKLAAALLIRHSNIRYVTSIRPVEMGDATNYCIAFAEHDPIVCPHKGKPLGDCPWIKPEQLRCPIHWVEHSPGRDATFASARRFAAAIKQELKQKGLQGEQLGIDIMDEAGRAALVEAGIKLVDAMPVMLEARAVKTQDEINLIRMAAAIADVTHFAIYQALTPGIRERELAAVGYNTLLRAGVEPQPPGIYVRSSGIQGGGTYTSDRIIQPGDVVTIDCVRCSFMGYQTCYYRNYVVGRKPTEKEKDLHRKSYERIYKALETIKPGMTTADTAKHFTPAREKGFDVEDKVWCEDIAHGIGLSLYEYPISNRLWSLEHPQAYEKGMTIAIETAEFDPVIGRPKLEEEVVVTDDGVEVITRMPIKDMMIASLINTAE